MKANIGCQEDVWGDVRVDIKRTDSTNLIADAQHLPFRDKVFGITKLEHLIEHLEDPYKALQEASRITTEKLIIAFPTENDPFPMVFQYLISLPFSIRGIRYVTRFISSKEHKWRISPELVMDFLLTSGWVCTVKKDATRPIFTFSHKLPSRISKYLPKITDEYVVTGSRISRFDSAKQQHRNSLYWHRIKEGVERS